MRTSWGNKELKIKDRPQTFFYNSEFSFFAKIRFNPFDSVPLATLLLQFCDITKGVLKINTGSLGLQVSVTIAKFSDLVIGYSLPPVSNRVS